MTTLAAILLLPLVAPTTQPSLEPAPVAPELGLAEMLSSYGESRLPALDGLWYAHGGFVEGRPLVHEYEAGRPDQVEPLLEALMSITTAAEVMDGEDAQQLLGPALRVGAGWQVREDLRAVVDLRILPGQTGEQVQEGVVGLQWACGPRTRIGFSFAGGSEGSALALSVGVRW